MKIVYDYQIFSTQRYGGVSRYFFELAKHLTGKESCDVEICSPIYVNEYLKNDSPFPVSGLKVPATTFPHKGRIIKCLNQFLLPMMVRSGKKIDIFHETYFTTSDNCPNNAKRIVTVYDMIHEKFSQYFRDKSATKNQKAHAVLRADHVICISENTRKDLIEILGVPKEKISVVYLGCSLPCQNDIKNFEDPEKPYILYVGNRKGYKNFELLLKAFSASKLLRNNYSIICFGGGGISSKEKDMVTALELPLNCLKYVGGDDSVLGGLYASAEVFVYPSLYEGFGIPPLEAMSYGCPVICANTSSMPEVVGDAAVLFDPKSESDLQIAMEKVAASVGYRGYLAAKGFERIKLFSWEKCAEETLLVYKKILGII